VRARKMLKIHPDREKYWENEMNVGFEDVNSKTTGARCFVKSRARYSFPPNSLIQTDVPSLSYVNDWVVEKLSSRLRAQTAECVMETFGISINTWTKMKKGLPIRRSVAERLLERVDHYL